MITPPIGMKVTVIKGVVGNDASLTTVFRGIFLIPAADAIAVMLFIAFPRIILCLPGLTE